MTLCKVGTPLASILMSASMCCIDSTIVFKNCLGLKCPLGIDGNVESATFHYMAGVTFSAVSGN